uniref:Aminopeptidase N n=1 Tax=Timema poppense TaxID=170557 RepID=A0A7R9CL12_TIMPO|nr:unnamed protein product [Timema poppensis]
MEIKGRFNYCDGTKTGLAAPALMDTIRKYDTSVNSAKAFSLLRKHLLELLANMTFITVHRDGRVCHNSVNAVVSFISSLSGVVTKREQVDKLKQFIEDNQDTLGSSAVTSATNTLASAERNLAWLDAHAQTIAAWINGTDTTTVAPGGTPSSYSSTTVRLMLLLSTVSYNPEDVMTESRSTKSYLKIPLVLITIILGVMAAVRCQLSVDGYFEDEHIEYFETSLRRPTEYRLPGNILPLHYNISLIPDLDTENFTFTGEITIRFRGVKDTTTIVLHMNDTVVDEDSMIIRDLKSNLTISMIFTEYNEDNHFYTIHPGGFIYSGMEYELAFKYEGNLRDDMQGLFRSSYVTKDGEPSIPNRDYNIDLHVIGSLVYCNSGAFDHVATKLIPYLDNDNFTFDGEVKIQVIVEVETNVITIHQNDTIIEETSVTDLSSGQIVPVTNETYEPLYHFHNIYLQNNLSVGQEYEIYIKYKGYLRDDMQGLFKSYYKTSDGQTRWMAATHFQPCRARRAFPCFDEPALKATFTVNIARTEDRQALSNMPVTSVSEPDPDYGNLTWDHFQTTPMPLSTYLMAFIVSDFKNLTVDDYLSVWQREDALPQANYSASIGLKVLRALEDYTELHFFLPKMDEVAVPDYQSGATEQWGLVTYRERLILFVEGVSTSAHRQNIATVIAHEFAHMWFGNLVSPKWWDVLWLNEGFASYFEYFALVEIEPDWRLEEQFVVRVAQPALSADSVNTSHPMTVDVSSPEEISAIFDTISYSKGIDQSIKCVKRMQVKLGIIRSLGTIRKLNLLAGYTVQTYVSWLARPSGLAKRRLQSLRKLWPVECNIIERRGPATIPMVSHPMGPGSSHEVNTMGNSSADAEDLFDALNEQYLEDLNLHDINVKTVMNTWTLQMGYPVLTVTRDYSSRRHGLKTSISQERFLLIPAINGTDTHDYKWWIPLTYTTKSELDFVDTETKQWLTATEESKQLTTPIINQEEWIIFNIQETSFYRVNYDATNWALIAAHLNSDSFEQIPPVNRAQLLDDVFNLARAGYVDYTLVLQMVKYLERETDYVPWYAAFNGLNYVDKRMRGAPSYDYYAWKRFILKLLNKEYTTLGSEGNDADDHVTKLFRNQILTWASLRHGGVGEWNFLWDRFITYSNVSTEQTLLLGVLGCTGDEDTAHSYMHLSLSKDSGIRQQDLSLVFPSVYNAHDKGVDFAISYLQLYYTNISDYHNSINSVVSLVSSLSSTLTSEVQVTNLRKFVEDIKDDLGDLAYASALNSLQVAERNLQWLETHSATIAEFAKEQNHRLPTAVVPESYTLKVIPYFEVDSEFTFDGEVVIRVNVKEPTDRIVLHVNQLDIVESSLTITSVSDQTQLTIINTTLDTPRQFFDIQLQEELVEGSVYDVKIIYVGYLNNDMAGFYRSYYKVGEETRWIATTLFHPTNARKALPCFDEPELKAKFRISIARLPKYHSISNSKRVETTTLNTTEDGRIWDEFEETPAMSTYLVSFIVSDFGSLSNLAGNVSVWARESAVSQAAYSVSISQDTLTALEHFTEIDYQLDKMDQAAIPDFSFGAMENWGLVTYRENLLLFDETVSTTANRQSIATIIAHEFSHQWFGDLVTPDWWTYPWLNEGFATYFEYFISAKVEPNWQLDQQFLVEVVQNAFATDALDSSRPMNYNITYSSEIIGVFDTITYDKAGSVIRMLEHVLTSETFRKGLSRYLKAQSYQSTNPDILYSHLQAQHSETIGSDESVDVKQIMDSWGNQKGYPIISVTRDYQAGTANVTQKRFLLMPTSDTSDDGYNWWVPLSYTSRSEADFTTTSPAVWITPSDSQLQLTGIGGSGDWVIFNIQETGYYRVNYDAQNWRLITNQLNSDQFDVIHVLNRAQLLDDSLNLARAGILDYATALDVTSYLYRETDYIPWYSAFNAFNFLNIRLRGASPAGYQLFKDYILGQLEDLYNSLEFQVRATDDHVTKLLRISVLSWACTFDHEGCVSNATQHFAQMMAEPVNYIIPADLTIVTYCTSLRHGGETEWEYLWQKYLTSTVSTEQVLLLSALGCTTQETLINRYLTLSITEDSGIRKQDAASVFSAVYSNVGGIDLAFNFLTENYESISQFYGGMNSIGNIITGIATRLSTQEQADRLGQFIESHQDNLGSALLASQRALETVQENLNWLDTNGEKILSWLNDTVNPTTTAAPTGNGASRHVQATMLLLLPSIVVWWRLA